MGDAKRIEVRPIAAKDATRIICTLHYSGRSTKNSQIHLGVFLDGKCGGALQFGPSIDRKRMCNLVKGTKPNECLELNRLAFADWLPRNSESRALRVSMAIIRKAYPFMKWVVSFADGCQCGDGAIYRASGFKLTSIKKSEHLAKLPSGEIIHDMVLKANPTAPRKELGGRSFFDVTNGKFSWPLYLKAAKAEVLSGFQLRYVFSSTQKKRRI